MLSWSAASSLRLWWLLCLPSPWQAAVLKGKGREAWSRGPCAIRYRSAGQRGSALCAIAPHWISCAVPEPESSRFHTCCLFPTHCKALPYHLIDLERKRRGSKCLCWFKMFQGDWKLWAMAWVRRTRPYWQGSILVKSVSHQLPKQSQPFFFHLLCTLWVFHFHLLFKFYL